MDMIMQEALIMIPVLNIIGKIIKETNLNNKWIPVLLLPFGILGACSIVGFNQYGVIQGVLVTGAAVYGNQVFKQLKPKKAKETENHGTEMVGDNAVVLFNNKGE